MKKFIVSILSIIASIVVLTLAVFVVIYISAYQIPLDENKLSKPFSKIEIVDCENTPVALAFDSHNVTKDDLTDNVCQSFISIEDKRFYEHGGIDYKSIARATIKNLKSMSFQEGGSTISQQLVKNTLLDNKKTLSRKIKELNLAKRLENKYEKNEILAMYLNAIYFGNGYYGINDASIGYFGKSADNLSLGEAAALSGIIKSPSKYSPRNNYDECVKRRNLVLQVMYDNGVIDENQYAEALNETLVIVDRTDKNKSSVPVDYIISECCEILGINETELLSDGYLIKTYVNSNLQSELANKFTETLTEFDGMQLILDNNTLGVLALCQTKDNLAKTRRQPASLIKPLLVYAPALENGCITLIDRILDEKTDFNGYSPNNAGCICHGNISVRNSIVKSLNIPAVKTLNYLGVDNALTFAEMLCLPLSDCDRNLALALGGISDGFTPLEIAAAYATFANNGCFEQCKFVQSIELDGKSLYVDTLDSIPVFSEETSYLVTDALVDAARRGTAKSLSKTGFNVAAKTGTNGGSDGNIDALACGYTKNYTHFSIVESLDNSPMPLNVTGSSIPIDLISNALTLVADKTEFSRPQGVISLDIDKYTLETEGKTLLADPNSPPQFIERELFNCENCPKISSNVFSEPQVGEVTISENAECIEICFQRKDIYDYEIILHADGQSVDITDKINVDSHMLSTYQKPIDYQSLCVEVIPINKYNSELCGQSKKSNVLMSKFELIP